MKEFIEKLIGRLEEELKLADETKEKCARENPLMFDNAKGYATGIANAKYFVNQLAEEYNNDFCEWKKTDKSKYSPYHHALKHGNITLEFHDDFKFCPYCGKKIKVVE